MAETIHAVLWFSDLRGYTAITESAPRDEVIPLLNDYAGVVIGSVQESGGDALKLVGDGTLAVFKDDDPATACRRALEAEARLRSRVAELNVRRAAEGRPVTTVYHGEGRDRIELAWTVAPILIVVVLALVTARAVYDVQGATTARGALEVTVIGH